MIEKELIITDIQKQIFETTDLNTKAALEKLLMNIDNGQYNVRIWE
jgi:hypothetical protein